MATRVTLVCLTAAPPPLRPRGRNDRITLARFSPNRTPAAAAIVTTRLQRSRALAGRTKRSVLSIIVAQNVIQKYNRVERGNHRKSDDDFCSSVHNCLFSLKLVLRLNSLTYVHELNKRVVRMLSNFNLNAFETPVYIRPPDVYICPSSSR